MEQEQAATVAQDPRVSPGTGFWIGAGAGLAMTVFMVALRFSLHAIVLPELLADWVVKLTPPPVFDFLLNFLGVGAKPLLFVLLLIGQVLAGGGLGMAYVRYGGRLPSRANQPWLQGILIGLALSLVVAGLFTPLIGGGFFGANVASGAPGYRWATVLPVLTYGVVLTNLYALVVSRREKAQVTGRREFLRRAAFFTFLAGVGAFAAGAFVKSISAITPSRVFSTTGQLPPEITPNGQFYEVSKNIINPAVDAATWKLEFSGDIGNPFVLTYDQLKALPWIEEYVTLECISNEVGGNLISNALWRGVQLKLLLDRAQLKPDTQRLAFHAADGYVDSLPLYMLLKDNVIVAYMMNGQPLPNDHGFPARIIAPGHWGMENVKWLTKVEPVSGNFRGYWQERGWADSASFNTMSRIDVPVDSSEIPEVAVAVGGVAFAGDRSIKQVEFSDDDGHTWQAATVKPPLSPYTWVLWTGNWTPASTGSHTLRVRATDGLGQPQVAIVQDTLPDGATGYHLIMVKVVKQAEEPKVG